MSSPVVASAAAATPQAPAPLFDDMGHWLQGLAQPEALLELAVLVLCVLFAWGIARGIKRSVDPEGSHSILLGQRAVDGALFPLLLLALGYAAHALLAQWLTPVVFRVALPALMALAVIRMVAKVLQVVFPQSAWVRPIERTLSWVGWGAVVLWVTGLLPVLLQDLDDIRWSVGGGSMSLRTLLEGLVSAVLVMIVALWVAAAIEARMLRSATGGSLSVRKALANALRAVLLFVGLIAALSVVGIDLTALSVLGGAVGVGIGLGLQKLAANYVSGFVILAERSVRIGDNVRVDGFEGFVTDISGRYTLIRSPAGRESIVPNEMLITNRVENLSLADPRVWQSTVVSVGYDSDVDLVMRLLIESVNASSRVLKDPAPSVALSAFGADGLEFTVGFWINDPQNGVLGLRSEINLAILRALRANGVEIPYPQRVLHLQASGLPEASGLPADTPDGPSAGYNR